LVPRLGRGPLPEAVVALPVQDPVPTREIEAIWRSSSHAHPAIQRLVAEFALIAERATHA
ncbi:MAG: LysR family transcriptional regulator, partial [Micropruina sp.]